jgi:hypothetical protein
MYLKNIKILNFKNIENLELNLNTRYVSAASVQNSRLEKANEDWDKAHSN